VTLAYANEHRPWPLYRAVFEALLLRRQPSAKVRRKFRFKNKLVSLDSTVIDLCATLLDWVQFRRTNQFQHTVIDLLLLPSQHGFNGWQCPS
jgi:hypothetical protein